MPKSRRFKGRRQRWEATRQRYLEKRAGETPDEVVEESGSRAKEQMRRMAEKAGGYKKLERKPSKRRDYRR